MKSKKWLEEDFEEVNCFRCGVKGHLLYKRDFFGVTKCPKCGQIFTSPRLKREARGKIYADSSYFNDMYGFSKKLNLALYLKKLWIYGRLNLISTLLKGNTKKKKLLEVGCGYGLFLESAKRKGFEITGIEYSQTAVKWIKQNLGLDVYRGEIEKIQLPANSYDVVCFWDVIEHVKDPLLFLKSVRHIMKKDGIIAFSCPYFNSIPARILKSRWWTLYPEQHLWYFTPNTLDILFSDAKLKFRGVVKNPLSLANLVRSDSFVGIAQK